MAEASAETEAEAQPAQVVSLFQAGTNLLIIFPKVNLVNAARHFADDETGEEAGAGAGVSVLEITLLPRMVLLQVQVQGQEVCLYPRRGRSRKICNRRS